MIDFVDSEYFGDLDIRRSTIGYIFTLGGGAISWRSILQLTVAFSTTKTEYIAIMECNKEAVWLCELVNEPKVS